MSAEALNQTLTWALRIAYPVTAVVLWRRWVPGVAFLAYLLSSSAWMWIVDEQTSFLYIALASGITSLLEIATTVEAARDFLLDDIDREGRVHRAMTAVWVVGLLTALLVYPPSWDRWLIYNMLRTAIDMACIAAMLVVITYAGKAQIKSHWLQQVHGVLWAGYLMPAVAGGVLYVKLPTTDDGGETWQEIQIAIYAATLAFLLMWILWALRTPRRGRGLLSP